MKLSMNNNRYPCLMYHEIAYPYKHKFYVHPKNFKEQMIWLKSNEFRPIDISKNDCDGNILLTFDDGHKSNLQAARYLKECGFVGIFYVVKDFSLNRADYLNENDIREIAAMGHIVGVHGKDHSWWTAKSINELIAELDETSKWIENITGKMPISCSAPGGQIRSREVKAIKRYLPYMRYIRTSFHDYNLKGDNLINSKGISVGTSIEEFEKIVRMDTLYYVKARTKCWLKDRVKDIVYKFKNISK